MFLPVPVLDGVKQTDDRYGAVGRPCLRTLVGLFSVSFCAEAFSERTLCMGAGLLLHQAGARGVFVFVKHIGGVLRAVPLAILSGTR